MSFLLLFALSHLAYGDEFSDDQYYLQMEAIISSAAALLDTKRECPSDEKFNNQTDAKLYCDNLDQVACNGKTRQDTTGFVSRFTYGFGQNAEVLEDVVKPLQSELQKYLELPDWNLLTRVRKKLPKKLSGLPEAEGNECVAGMILYYRYAVNNVPFKGECAKAMKTMGNTLKKIVQGIRPDEIDSFLTQAYEKSPMYQRLKTEIYPRVQEAVKAVIRANVKHQALVEKMERQVDGAGLQAMVCGGGPEKYEFGRGAFFGEKGIGVCPGLSSTCTSHFCLVNVLAHELGHSMDPCALVGRDGSIPTGQAKEFSPFQDALKCLSNNKSLNVGPDHMPVCDNSLLTEAFADLVATEALPIYMRNNQSERVKSADAFRVGYANTMFVCEPGPTSRMARDNHPSVASRVKLFMNAPAIRSQMGCEKVNVPGGCTLAGSVTPD